MRALIFAKKNIKELLREPLGFVFMIVLPLFLLFAFSQFNIPDESYRLENLTPGLLIFGFSFVGMFSAITVAKDRGSSQLVRLAISPMRPQDFIIGYMLSFLPAVILQNILFFSMALILGLEFTLMIIPAMLLSLPVSLLYILIGILIGSLTSEKSASGISSILVQLVCFTGGVYFPKELLGEFFSLLCDVFPFSRSVDIIRSVMNGSIGDIGEFDVIIPALYTLVIGVLAVIAFNKKMSDDSCKSKL